MELRIHALLCSTLGILWLSLMARAIALSADGSVRDARPSAHRHLLQGSCGLYYSGQQQLFASCVDLNATLGTDYNLLWSVLDSGTGSGSILSAAIDVQQPGGWAAFGFPAAPGSGMIGGSAMIVKADPKSSTGASVNSYYLGGYAPSQVTPPGKLSVVSSSAALSGGRLQAVFQLRLPQNPQDIQGGPTPVLYAMGPLDGSGSLLPHPDSQGVEDSINLGAPFPRAHAPIPATLAPGGAQPAAGAMAPPPPTAAPALSAAPRQQPVAAAAGPPVTSAAPQLPPPAATVPPAASATMQQQPRAAVTAPALAGAPQQQQQQQQQQPRNTAVNASMVQMHAASVPAPAPTADARVSVPRDISAGCGLQFGGRTHSFAQCKTLTHDASNIQLLWSLAAEPQGNGSVMTGALECANGDGWCSWGLPFMPGRMVGASAIIMKACPSCSTGASADNYYLGSKATSGVVAGTGNLLLSSMQAAKSGSSLISLFTLHLPPDAHVGGIDCIGAYGPLAADNSLQSHISTAALAGSIDLSSGMSNVDIASGPSDSAVVAHGVVMVVALAILVPGSVGIAHSMRGSWGPRLWFQLHRALGVVVLLCVLIGAALGIYLWSQQGGGLAQLLVGHITIGIIIVVFVLLQATAVALRPHPDSKLRRGWNYYHHTVGHLVVLLGFANALMGFKVGGLGWGWYVGLVMIWCAILLAAMIKWLRDACVEPKGNAPEHAAAESDKDSMASATPRNGQL